MLEVGTWVELQDAWYGCLKAVFVRKDEDLYIFRYEAFKHPNNEPLWVSYQTSQTDFIVTAPADDEGRRVAALRGPYGEGFQYMPPPLPEVPPIAPVKRPFAELEALFSTRTIQPSVDLHEEELEAWIAFSSRELEAILAKAGWTPDEYLDAYNASLLRQWEEEDRALQSTMFRCPS